MAVKWAVQAGDWTTPTIWNGGTIPQSGDYVYSNGFIITRTGGINIGVGTLSNEPNADYGINAGGGFSFTVLNNIYITANMKQYGTTQLIRGGITLSGANFSIVGDISNDKGFVFAPNVTQPSVSIFVTGNVYVGNTAPISFTSSSNYPINLIINGNVVKNGIGDTLFGTYTNISDLTNCTITGNLEVSVQDNQSYATPTITGTFTVGGKFSATKPMLSIVNAVLNDVEILDSAYISGTTANFNSNLKIDNNAYSAFTTSNFNDSNGILTIGHGSRYSATNHSFNGIKIEYYDDSQGVAGIEANNTFSPINEDFQWINLSEPRELNFRILTNYDFDNTDQYPAENRVIEGVEYAFGEKTGTFVVDYPPESVVLDGYIYDNGEKVGTLENQTQVGCVTKEDVREGVALIGMYEDEQQVVGTLVVPSVDDVREGVIFDNGSVGTLIVQGGGDRLRIADFGNYTNAQSDTYIVDLTEQDKPKFAVAEERVLIEMFPDLDLENIPEKYFDDLFVKYLKYRLIVEYYRTAGINSTFTPSEPTTEIVNYRNVNCEIWMNIANTYLKAWGEKYPNSIKKQRILL